MASLRAKIFNWRMKAQLKPHPLHLIDPAILRANVEKTAPKRAPKHLRLEKINEAGVKGEWHRPADEKPARTILYLHGGGYVFGSAVAYRALTFALARECAAEVFSLDYRLAPEHPFPAAVEDAIAAWSWLNGQGRAPTQTIIAGDSAGGGLALALMISCREKNLPAPAGAILYSPWTDLTVSGASVDANEESDIMFRRAYIEGGAGRYLNGADPKTPLASPLFADLAGLPPMLIFASADESLCDDSVRVHEKLRAAGGASTLIIENGLSHVWPAFVGYFPEAMRAIRRTAEFVDERLGAGRDQ